MATWTGPASFRERPDSRSKLYWLDVDVTFHDVIRQQRMIRGNHIVRRPPSFLKYSVLQGVGAVANALSVGDRTTTFDRFEVYVTAFLQTDEDFEHSQSHRAAKMIWNELDARSPRLEIYVQTKMLRHLLELYVTKRIDTVIMSMKIEIVRQIIADADTGSELLPLLDKDGHLYFRRTQCELLSVQASLAHARIRGAS
jgi:hypothetical protein